MCRFADVCKHQLTSQVFWSSTDATSRWQNAIDCHWQKAFEVVVGLVYGTQNFNDYLRRKRGIVQIDNKDRLCLPRAIVVGRAYTQHFDEKFISKHEYQYIVGIKKSQDDQKRELARDLRRN